MEALEPMPLEADSPIQPRGADWRVPLTATQRRIWNGINWEVDPLSLRVCASAVRLLGPFNAAFLRKSIDAVIERHEALRTRFILVDGIPRQHIDHAGEYELRVIDLSNSSPAAAESEVKRLAEEFLKNKIDLSIGPIFEARAWKLSDREHVLVLVIDHMVSDGISNGILNREIWTLYDQATRGSPLSLPPLPVQFADYAVWQHQTCESWMRKHETYWKDRMAGVRRTVIPADPGLSQVDKPVGLTVNIPFGKALTAKLRAFAQREGTMLSLIVLTVYAIVMSRWCHQRDLLIAFSSHGRIRRRELENVIGFVANFLHLRIDVSSEKTFSNLLREVRQELTSAFEHQDFDRVPDFIPECQSEVIFNWQLTHWVKGDFDHHVTLECASELDWKPPWERNSGRHLKGANDELRMKPFPTYSPIPVKFCPIFFSTPDEIHMPVVYRPDIFALSTIEQFGHDLLRLAEEIAEQPLTVVALAGISE